jgi:Family of unknown function (DUF6600)
MKSNCRLAILCLTAGLSLPLATLDCRAQSTNAVNLPSGVQDVVKLVKAGLNEQVVLAQIKTTGSRYNLSVDQIIYLHDQGVTQNEITALMAATPPATTAPSATAPPPAAPPATTASAAPTYAPAPIAPAVPEAPEAPAAPVAATAQPATLAAFQGELSPYGSWIDIPGYGLCWQPYAAVGDPFWRPYCDQGHWVYTDDGWFWQSDYPWGEVAFHYGRWFYSGRGWVWVPGYDWAPAWVCWRQAEGYVGWAPLPPGAVFRPGLGLYYHGALAVDIDFGLRAHMFTFVPYDRFWDHDLHRFLVPRDRVAIFFDRSHVLNGYRFVHGRFGVFGIGRERIGVFTHREVRIEAPAHRWGWERRDFDRGRFPGRDEHWGEQHRGNENRDHHRR